MILYQLSKWVEERNHLVKVIQESQGDVSLLQYRKNKVDEEMRIQANRWMDNEPVTINILSMEASASEAHPEARV
jgi:hypothetical protein